MSAAAAAGVITTGIVAFTVVAIVRPDVAHHALNVVEKAIDAVSGNSQRKDTEMSHENRRGRTRCNN